MKIKSIEIGIKEYFCILIIILGITDLSIILNIPFLRQIFGFIFLTILPGLLILQILKLNNLKTIETIVYSVGLSVAFLMFGGLLINTIYPLLGILKPISLFPLIITINISIVILCFLGYKINKDFITSSPIPIKEILSPPALLLYSLPFLTILGAFLVRFHHNNILLLLIIVVISLMVVLVTFGKFIPKNLYPLVIFMISISLLYHRSLVSPYLFGSDIYFEYQTYNLVKLNSHWASSVLSTTSNAMLSITILPAIYSSLLNMEGTWIYKIIYPLLFSFMPLGLYRIYQKQTDEKIAFLSSFFFVSFNGFFISMLFLMRQEIAELFLVLLILLMVDKEMKSTNRAVLSIIFGASLVISHYGVSYIYLLAFLPFIYFSSFFMNGIKKANITGTYVAFYSVIALSWYMYLTNSVTFNTGVEILNNIVCNIGNLFSPLTSNSQVAANFSGGTESIWYLSNRFFFNLTELFIIVGVVRTILKHKEMDFDKEYFSAVIVSIFVIASCIILSGVAGSLNMDRIYGILLIFLAPFCLLGGITICEIVSKLFRHISLNKSAYVKIVVLTVLIPYFLFNTGFVYEVVRDVPASIPLGIERMKESENLKSIMYSYSGCIRERDVYGVVWLSHVSNTGQGIYSDDFASYPLIGYGMIPRGHIYQLSNTTLQKGAYVYLGSLNVVEGIVRNWGAIFNITEVSPQLEEKNRIYTNGGSEIYK